MAALEDELKGKSVKVEVHLRCGAGGSTSNSASARTMVYEGTYHGTSFIGAQEMLVLTDANHISRSNCVWGRDETTKITSKQTYIALNDIVSIDVD